MPKHLKFFIISAVLSILFSISAYAQIELYEVGQNPPAKPGVAKDGCGKEDIGYADALVLGVVEGVTEYLPVSSTGHLILANALLGLDTDTPLCDSSGAEIYDIDGSPYTMKMAADAYAIVIQFGAILAVAVIYWQYLLKMLAGLLGRNPEGLRLLRNLIAAFLPAAVVGLILHDFIESQLFGVKPVIFALAAGAVLMLAMQKYYDKRQYAGKRYPKLEDMKLSKAFLIGALQCVAMWPGTSRSMMTILGGYLAGLRPSDSAKFSFLLGFVTLSAAAAYKTYKDGAAIAEALSFGPLAMGMLVAFISAAISVHWMVGFLTRKGLAPFAYYRFILAAVLIAALYFNFI